MSDELPVGITLHQLNEKECLSFLSKIKKTNLANHPSTNSSLSCTPSIIKINVDAHFSSNRLIEIIYSGGMDNKSVHPVLYIELKKSSNLSIVERFNHSGTLIMPLQLIEIGELASLKSVKIFDDNKTTYNLSAHSVILSDKSNYNSFSLIKGSEFTRSETHAYLNGKNSKLNLNGVYISGGDQHHDLTTVFITHDAVNCESRQVFKKVLRNGATGVFQGKILVKADAQKTDGYQISQGLLLSLIKQVLMLNLN